MKITKDQNLLIEVELAEIGEGLLRLVLEMIVLIGNCILKVNTFVLEKKLMKVSPIKYILAIRNNENYSPAFKSVSMCIDKNMMLIKSVISRIETKK